MTEERLRPSRRSVLRSVSAGIFGVVTSTRSEAGVTRTAARSTATPAIEPELVEADEQAGFNFPYYLYSPAEPREKPLLVEPVNSGGCDDDFQKDLDAADDLVRDGLCRQLSDRLRVPLVVPVFPNPCEGAFAQRFIQYLDTETMHIESGEFERIDRQLLRMIDDAQARLADNGIEVPSEVMLNGFSATGNFVNNFTILHPDRISSVTAGAINGMPTLPYEQVDGYTTNYQIGVADLNERVDESFDKSAWQDVAQFYYMGETETDADDTLPYRDVWSEDQARKARAVYGDDMQTDRLPYGEMLYHAADATARFEVYDGVGHTYTPDIVRDLVSFHRRNSDIISGSFQKSPFTGSELLQIDINTPNSDAVDQYEVRAFVNETEATRTTLTAVPGASMELTVELDRALELDDSVAVGVFEPGDSDLSEAVLTIESNVEAGASFVTVPSAGDSEIEASYALSTSASKSAQLSVVTDGDSNYWERRIGLEPVRPGESGTETFQLDSDREGVPFEDGDEVQLWLIPNGNQTPERAVVIETVNVGHDETDSHTDIGSPSTCGSEHGHDEVDVSFAARPTVSDKSVKVDTTVDTSFGQRARTRLFPETGGGTWGLDLDWVDAGTSEVRSYATSSNYFRLGETLEVRAFPADWSGLDDVIASDCAVVSGVRTPAPPHTGDREITVEYLHPADADGTGELQVSAGGEVVGSYDGIDPGAMEQRTLSLEGLDDGIPDETDLELTLRASGETDPIDTITVTPVPSGRASVSFAEGPEHSDHTLTLDYELSEGREMDVRHEFVALRLYTEQSSSWGIYLDRIEPGESGTDVFDINLDEPGVPLQSGQDIEIALVDGRDPYAQRPLATTGATVTSDASFSVSIEQSRSSPSADEPVTFEAAVVSDSDGSAVSYEWSIDGTTRTGDTVAHAFPDAGEYDVVLTGTDGSGNTATATTVVTVRSPHPSGVSRDVWDAVTAQNEPGDELTFQDLLDTIDAYHTGGSVDGTDIDFGDVTDLVAWYRGV